MSEVKFLVLRDNPDGSVELHWRDKPVGESLQGWYPSRTKARKAAKLLPPSCQLDLGPVNKPPGLLAMTATVRELDQLLNEAGLKPYLHKPGCNMKGGDCSKGCSRLVGHDDPPEGYLPCTRDARHEGPCTHPLRPKCCCGAYQDEHVDPRGTSHCPPKKEPNAQP